MICSSSTIRIDLRCAIMPDTRVALLSHDFLDVKDQCWIQKSFRCDNISLLSAFDERLRLRTSRKFSNQIPICPDFPVEWGFLGVSGPSTFADFPPIQEGPQISAASKSSNGCFTVAQSSRLVAFCKPATAPTRSGTTARPFRCSKAEILKWLLHGRPNRPDWSHSVNQQQPTRSGTTARPFRSSEAR